MKISNDKWTLLVYKDLNPIQQTIDNNNKILEGLVNMISEPLPQAMALRTEVQTHFSLLNQISKQVNLKYEEIFAGTQQYAPRQKRGVFNGIGTVWKSITGNLDSSDGEYFNDCINKVVQDEHQIENLMKNQITVTTSVIKNFNNTIQKLQVDEETFNHDIKTIRSTLLEISNDLSYYELQIKLLNLCESLMESYVFVKDYLNDIHNSISFARLKIIHNTIINPTDLLNSLKEISQSLKRNNLPLATFPSNVAQYLEIIELKAYQLNNKVVFVLSIPLTEPETYTLYRLYPIPLLDNRTGLHHILPTTIKFIAKDDDSMSYLPLRDLKNCQPLTNNVMICSDLLPYPIDNNAICEAQLLKPLKTFPSTCSISTIIAEEYNVQEVNPNIWLVSISEALPVTIKCEGQEAITNTISTTSLIHLQYQCNAYIGSTRIHTKQQPEELVKNVTYRSHPVQIPFECCQNFPPKTKIPNLKPLKLNKLDVEDLNIAHHKLNQYSDQLDKIINEPFVTKNLSWFTILTMLIVIIIIIFYIFHKWSNHRRSRTGIDNSHDDHPPAPSPNPREAIRQSFRKLLPRRRPSIHFGESTEDINLNINKSSA